MQVYLIDRQHNASTKCRSILFTNCIFSSPAGTIGAFNYIYSVMHDILRTAAFAHLEKWDAAFEDAKACLMYAIATHSLNQLRACIRIYLQEINIFCERRYTFCTPLWEALVWRISFFSGIWSSVRPDWSRSHACHGAALEGIGRPQDALEAFQKAAKVDLFSIRFFTVYISIHLYIYLSIYLHIHI